MAKRKETIGLEDALRKETRDKRIYGCEEVTIGFYNNGRGNEVVDFMTMNSKGIIKCYEIKVTKADLQSRAKKSWYGDYNYLVISQKLYESISTWKEFLPEHVGLIVGYPSLRESQKADVWTLDSKIRATRKKLDTEIILMLKESLIRSLYWKIEKYRDAQSLEKYKALNADARQWEKNIGKNIKNI